MHDIDQIYRLFVIIHLRLNLYIIYATSAALIVSKLRESVVYFKKDLDLP